jgi:hypothetical protein
MRSFCALVVPAMLALPKYSLPFQDFKPPQVSSKGSEPLAATLLALPQTVLSHCSIIPILILILFPPPSSSQPVLTPAHTCSSAVMYRKCFLAWSPYSGGYNRRMLQEERAVVHHFGSIGRRCFSPKLLNGSGVSVPWLHHPLRQDKLLYPPLMFLIGT